MFVLFLVERKNLHVLILIFLIIFKLFAVFGHKFGLGALKGLIEDDLLKSECDFIEKDIIRRDWMI